MSGRVHRGYVIVGRVQGVGYRAHVERVATRYEVVGSVRNLMDGSVRVEVQGDPHEVDRFLAEILLPIGPIHPEVVARTEELPLAPSLSTFQVARGSR